MRLPALLLLAAAIAPPLRAQDGPAYPPDTPGAAEFRPGRFLGHEPVYFLAGPKTWGSKFQISFRYRLFDPSGTWASARPFLRGVNLAFTQTSLWDIGRNSDPFRDTSYQPELFYETPVPRAIGTNGARAAWQTGFHHESNGKAGADSRRVNEFYLRPLLRLPAGRWHADLSARFAVPLGPQVGNRDLAKYRGRVRLGATLSREGGPQWSLQGGIGDGFVHGWYQADYTDPLRGSFKGNVDLYFHAQYFEGWAESLLEYRRRSRALRIGIALVR